MLKIWLEVLQLPFSVIYLHNIYNWKTLLLRKQYSVASWQNHQILHFMQYYSLIFWIISIYLLCIIINFMKLMINWFIFIFKTMISDIQESCIKGLGYLRQSFVGTRETYNLFQWFFVMNNIVLLDIRIYTCYDKVNPTFRRFQNVRVVMGGGGGVFWGQLEK